MKQASYCKMLPNVLRNIYIGSKLPDVYNMFYNVLQDPYLVNAFQCFTLVK